MNMANLHKQILEDNVSGSLTITLHTLQVFGKYLDACQHQSSTPAKCYQDLQNVSKEILKSQPNMVALRRNVYNFLSHYKRQLANKSSAEQIYLSCRQKLEQLQANLHSNLDKIAALGSKLIVNSNRIMTISHSTAVRTLLTQAQQAKKRFRVFALKSHPPDEGVVMAEYLTAQKIKTTLISDAEMGLFMKDMNMVLVGADRVYGDGFVNKTGTLPLLLTASHFNVPVYLVFDTGKILSEQDRAVKFVERSLDEIYDDRENGKELQVRNYYFERIPLDLVTKIICEEGVYNTAEFVDWYL